MVDQHLRQAVEIDLKLRQESLRVNLSSSRSTVEPGSYIPVIHFVNSFTFSPVRYYCQDDDSGRLMTQTLATLPPSQRAPFSRIQASIRSAYHRSVNARRHAEFQAHLSATTPGGSLMPHARAHPRDNVAQKGMPIYQQQCHMFANFLSSD